MAPGTQGERSAAYSDRRLVMGLARAAFTERQAMVSRAIAKVDKIASANIFQSRGIRYLKS